VKQQPTVALAELKILYRAINQNLNYLFVYCADVPTENHKLPCNQFVVRNSSEIMRLLLTTLLLTSLSALGQSLPDSIIIIIRNTYVNNFSDGENLYQAERFSIVRNGNSYNLNNNRIGKGKIRNLLSAISDRGNENNSLAKYQIDTNWIKTNPGKLLAYYSNKEDFTWNEKQKEFIYTELTDLQNYKESLAYYLSDGCCYTMHNSYKGEYIIQLFSKGNIINTIKSRRYVWGYKMPWTTQIGDTLYNYEIETALKKIISTKEKTKKPLHGNKLLGYMVNRIVENNVSTLYVLSAYSYLNEIEELKTDFQILSFNEVQARGRYIWNEPATMRVRLWNKYMLDNVNILFLASKTGNTIYSRDSLKKDYKEYIDRMQSIKFATTYLKSHPNTRLDIYYFNNKGINDYNIDNVNKNPKEWAKYDNWVEGLKWDSAHNIKLSFDINESIRVSKQVDCGCNYRFDRSYIEQAIFFEIKQDEGNSSIWFLLPDNKVLLYIMDGMEALNFKRTDFTDTKNYSLIYPCALFDTDGKRVTK
jgi:hypothetical protein